MDLQRFCVKFFARPSAEIDDATFIEIFHDWIRQQRLPGVLIDVADYRHVPDGPGVLLITHEADIAMDHFENRLGLLYQRKRGPNGLLHDRILAAIQIALTACVQLQREPRLTGDLTFSAEEFEFTANDRLLAPNNDATIAALKTELETVAQRLYRTDAVHAGYVSQDPNERVRLHVKASAPADIEAVLENARCRPH
ncbi:MAG: hypothetical protein ACE5LB_10285 [Acidiferrobacterales bacterium]